MNEETKALVQETLRDAIEHGLEVEVVYEMLNYLYKNTNCINPDIIMACAEARKEWDL